MNDDLQLDRLYSALRILQMLLAPPEEIESARKLIEKVLAEHHK